MVIIKLLLIILLIMLLVRALWRVIRSLMPQRINQGARYEDTGKTVINEKDIVDGEFEEVK